MKRSYLWLRSAAVSLLFPLVVIPISGFIMSVDRGDLDVRSLVVYGMLMFLYAPLFGEMSATVNVKQAVSFGTSRKNVWKGFLTGTYLLAPLVLVLNTAAAGFLYPEAEILYLALANLGVYLAMCGSCGIVTALGMKLQGIKRNLTLFGGAVLAVPHMFLLPILFDIPAFMWAVLAESCVLTVIFVIVSRKVLLSLDVKI